MKGRHQREREWAAADGGGREGALSNWRVGAFQSGTASGPAASRGWKKRTQRDATQRECNRERSAQADGKSQRDRGSSAIFHGATERFRLGAGGGGQD